jgi:alkanesulfonate monooxygenase
LNFAQRWRRGLRKSHQRKQFVGRMSGLARWHESGTLIPRATEVAVMPIEFIWQLPSGSDGRYGNGTQSRRGERASAEAAYFKPGVSDPRGTKFNYLDYLHQVARAADLAGFDGLQVRNDPQGDESWILAGYVARGTRHVRLLTEFDASRGSAVYAAKNAVSFQRYSGNRFAWQIGTGGSASQRLRQGDSAPDSDVGPRIEEFVTVARGVIASGSYSYKGRHFEVLDGGFKGPLSGQKAPPVYLSGNDTEAYERSARVADVHVFDALPLRELQAEIARLRAVRRAESRLLGLGLRTDVLARETEEEAVFDARRQLAQIQDDAAQIPHLSSYWPAFASGSTGARGALVGSYKQITGLLTDYARAGIGTFILAAVPHLEEAYRIGEHVLPAVRAALGSPTRSAA